MHFAADVTALFEHPSHDGTGFQNVFACKDYPSCVVAFRKQDVNCADEGRWTSSGGKSLDGLDLVTGNHYPHLDGLAAGSLAVLTKCGLLLGSSI